MSRLGPYNQRQIDGDFVLTELQKIYGILNESYSPTLINSFSWSEGTGVKAGMAVNNGWLYVCEYTKGSIATFSLADPTNPTFVRRFPTSITPRNILILAGRYLVVSCPNDNVVEFYDLSNPGIDANLVGSIAVTSCKAIAVEGNEIFIGSTASKVEKWEFFLPSNGDLGFSARKLGQVTVAVNNLGLALNGSGILAVSSLDNNQLQLIETLTLNTISTTGFGGVGHPWIVWISRTQLLMTDRSNSRLHSIDCSDLSSPVLDGSAVTGTNPEEILVIGNTAFTPELTSSGDPSSLNCIDISNMKNPTTFKRILLSSTGGGFLAYYKEGDIGRLFVNGHSPPDLIDVIDVKPLEEKPLQPEIKEFVAGRFGSFAELMVGSFLANYRTSVEDTTILKSDFVLRVGGGAEITLPNPTNHNNQVIVLANVGGSDSVVVNAFLGYSGTLASNTSVVLMGSIYGSNAQWDRVANFSLPA